MTGPQIQDSEAAFAGSGALVRAARRDRRATILALTWLLLLAAYLVLQATRLTVFDDEALIALVAARDHPTATLRDFFTATGRHTHPPLYDVFLHEWIRLTGGTLPLLRVPSILFYCVALWIIAAVAAMRGVRRDVAMIIACAWPPGMFVGVPAHWSSLAILGIAGMTWSCLQWRQSHRARHAALFAAFTIGLLYTNYFALLISTVLVCTALASGFPRRGRRAGGIALAAVAVASLPLLLPIYRELQAGPPVSQPPIALAAQAVYRVYSLLAGETVAPWSRPALLIFIGAAGLLVCAVQARRVPFFFALLGIIYVPAAVAGLLDGKRLGLFAPWFVLGLIEVVWFARRPRLAVASLTLVFVTAWLGGLSHRWTATYRYIEPWREAVDESVRESGVGDLVICNHASYYYYAHERLGWEDWPDPYVRDVFHRSGRTFSSVFNWREALPGHRGIVYVRSVMPPDVMEEHRALLAYLDEHAREGGGARYLRDPGSGLKNLFTGNQPEWRIEIRRFELDD